MQRKHSPALALMAALLLAPKLHADDGWDRAVFLINEENDSRFSDRHYTQGARLSFLSEDHLNSLSRCVPSVGYDAVRWKWGVDGGQEIYTPEKISASRSIPND